MARRTVSAGKAPECAAPRELDCALATQLDADLRSLQDLWYSPDLEQMMPCIYLNVNLSGEAAAWASRYGPHAAVRVETERGLFYAETLGDELHCRRVEREISDQAGSAVAPHRVDVTVMVSVSPAVADVGWM